MCYFIQLTRGDFYFEEEKLRRSGREQVTLAMV